MNLDYYLDTIVVGVVDDYHNEINGGGLTAILGWYYVDNDGVFVCKYRKKRKFG